MMDRVVFAEHHDRLVTIVGRIHKNTALIALLSFIGYGFAAYIWFKGYQWPGFVIATGSYLVFRLFRTLSLSMTRRQLASREGFASTFIVLDQEMATRKPHIVLSEVEALIKETQDRANTP